jgi:hypothetical protein
VVVWYNISVRHWHVRGAALMGQVVYRKLQALVERYAWIAGCGTTCEVPDAV